MKIKDICEYGKKSKIKAGEGLNEGNVKLFTSSSESNKFVNEEQFSNPGIIMGTGGNATLHYCDEPFSVSTDCLVLFPKIKVSPKYLYYFFKGNFHVLQSGFKGAGLKHTSKKYIDEISINHIPNNEEQIEIVKILDNVNDIILKKNQQLSEYDQLIKSRFVEMFGDPVTNTNKWGIENLGVVCDVRDGTHDSPKYVSEGYPLITSKNLVDGYIDFSNVNMISKDDLYSINKRSKVDFGDILMPMIGTIGNPIIVKENEVFAIKNVALIKFRRDSRVINTYIKSLLESDYFENAVSGSKRGGTQKFISLGNIRTLPIAVPPIELQHQFAQIIQQVDKLKFEVQKSLDETQMLFDSLMQEYFG
jgi:type I restriction enzyme S subunit